MFSLVTPENFVVTRRVSSRNFCGVSVSITVLANERFYTCQKVINCNMNNTIPILDTLDENSE